MVGFAWLTLRQAREALKNGRLEEAYRLLCQPAAQGYKGSWELLVEVGQRFVERGERHLQQNDRAGAWNDLVMAEQVGADENAAVRLRQALIRLGIEDIERLLSVGEPARVLEVIAELRNRSAQQPELPSLEEAAKSWVQANEQAGRGEFAQAIQSADRVRRLLPQRLDALEKAIAQLEHRHQTFTDMLVQLHDAAERREWREVVRLAEQVLALAPQHMEARKARARAWRVIEPQTVAALPRRDDSANGKPAAPEREKRFLLWIDGVGGFLVCLGARVTIGQATPDAYVDIPLFADVSRIHAALTRDTEGYLLEATRALLVNGQPVEKALLQSGDRITLGSSCQLQFRQPVPVSASARLDLVSGHRLPLTVDGVLLMADTLVLGPGSQVHVPMPDMQKPIVLYRQKDLLGVRYAGNLSVDGQRCCERCNLRPNSTVSGDDFAFAIEPVGTGTGRL
jgi:tetratricopeptide (TPR) repeat protein